MTKVTNTVLKVIMTVVVFIVFISGLLIIIFNDVDLGISFLVFGVFLMYSTTLLLLDSNCNRMQ